MVGDVLVQTVEIVKLLGLPVLPFVVIGPLASYLFKDSRNTFLFPFLYLFLFCFAFWISAFLSSFDDIGVIFIAGIAGAIGAPIGLVLGWFTMRKLSPRSPKDFTGSK